MAWEWYFPAFPHLSLGCLCQLFTFESGECLYTYFDLPWVLSLTWLFRTFLWPQKMVRIITIFFQVQSAALFMDLSGGKMINRFNLLGQFWLNAGGHIGHCNERSFGALPEHTMKEGHHQVMMSVLYIWGGRLTACLSQKCTVLDLEEKVSAKTFIICALLG